MKFVNMHTASIEYGGIVMLPGEMHDLNPPPGDGHVWVRAGLLKASDVKRPPPSSLAGYAEQGAMAIIDATTDVELLTQWAAAEKRRGVLRALEARVAALP